MLDTILIWLMKHVSVCVEGGRGVARRGGGYYLLAEGALFINIQSDYVHSIKHSHSITSLQSCSAQMSLS